MTIYRFGSASHFVLSLTFVVYALQVATTSPGKDPGHEEHSQLSHCGYLALKSGFVPETQSDSISGVLLFGLGENYGLLEEGQAPLI